MKNERSPQFQDLRHVTEQILRIVGHTDDLEERTSQMLNAITATSLLFITSQLSDTDRKRLEAELATLSILEEKVETIVKKAKNPSVVEDAVNQATQIIFDGYFRVVANDLEESQQKKILELAQQYQNKQ